MKNIDYWAENSRYNEIKYVKWLEIHLSTSISTAEP